MIRTHMNTHCDSTGLCLLSFSLHYMADQLADENTEFEIQRRRKELERRQERFERSIKEFEDSLDRITTGPEEF